MWILADAHNGYFCNLTVYCGKDSKTEEKGLASNVVKQLTSHIKEKNQPEGVGQRSLLLWHISRVEHLDC